ncbi:hypothetical protein L6164_036458 [Bauhinia variegata]|uniref:Uncharacterized protein n=1 Tax=Bauhinia variegata TaxID=167791 RepID=A0ACB9KH59_BAUVA|nr:hypothetical protein L6164_036458 [Bauhinia variegata]
MATTFSSHPSNVNRETEEIYAKMDWNNLGFNLTPTDYIYVMESTNGGIFSEGALKPYGNIEISPASAVLNYGQGLFEGMKAYRREDGGIQLFRPEENALRMQMGAERLLMAAPSVEQFISAVKQTVLANKRWVPPCGKGSLYVRPLLFGSGAVMGINPAPESTFLIFTCPLGNFYKGGSAPLNLVIEETLPRAYPGGTGGVKNISNYSPVFSVVKEAKAKGFGDVLFLDAVDHKYVEEVSSCNIFVIKGNVISTPETDGTILPGITRKSIIQIARDLGYQAEERKVPVEDVLDADEVFCSGTAVGISPVGSVTYHHKRVEFKTGEGTVSQKIFDTLRGILAEAQDKSHFPIMAPPSVLSASQSTGNSAGENYADFNWDELGYGIIPTDFMYTMKCLKGEKFSEGNLTPYGNIEISPSSGVLNYGQGVFEGLKAYRTENDHVLLFRPEENAQRMKMGAERMCTPCLSTEQFVNAVKQTVLANKRWVPPLGKGTLYIRPLLMGTGDVLGLAPAPEYTFLIYTSPVNSFHKGPVNLVIKDKIHRALFGNGGTGGVKSITNYAPTYKALIEAKEEGFANILYLDAATGKYIEEVSACNVFMVKGNAISTPRAEGTILPGITRKSIIEIALDLGYEVTERAIPLEELLEADEVFCTGTAVVVDPVVSVTYKDKRAEYRTGSNSVSQKLHERLVGIQTGRIEDTKGWTLKVD